MSYPLTFGEFQIRPFDITKDLPAAKQIWRECGWIEKEDDEAYLDDFYSIGKGFAATLDDQAESIAHVAPGSMQYQQESVKMAAVSSVVTSAIARKRGLARIVSAHALASAADDGYEIAALGMFEQGFYDQLGFGSGSYEQVIAFDPADLTSPAKHRIPRRLTKTDWAEVNSALKNRWLNHGGCVLDDSEFTKAHLGWYGDGWGLGYFDDQNELTHFFYGKLKGESGPFSILRFAYQDADQLQELISLIASLGDQVSRVSMVEPAHVQLQDLLRQPFRFRQLSKGSEMENYHKACSFWQVRILNLESCISKTHLLGPEVAFNLKLTDPLCDYVSQEKLEWCGSSGEFVVRLGEDSSAEPGSDRELPTLSATINAFSRLWLGVRPATELAVSDKLEADDELLESLDDAIRLPAAKLGWYF